MGFVEQEITTKYWVEAFGYRIKGVGFISNAFLSTREAAW